MGHKFIQRIHECAECGRTPDDGEPMWDMPDGPWCEECCNQDEDEAAEAQQRRGWWCPTCGEAVPPEMVTYEETHDARYGGCGHEVEARERREVE